MHAAPVEQPANASDEDGLFAAAVVFIMPTTAGTWALRTAIEVGNVKDTVLLALPLVTEPEESRMIGAVSPVDAAKYFISLIAPMQPEAKLNDLEFTVHTKKSMMDFPAVNDLKIVFEPTMPSMDHGSPNNVNPVFISNGHYKGKVNFTMTGWWQLDIDVIKGYDTILPGIKMDISF
ncbi:MAG: hypothetical protein HC896_08245 [Bacteroidales bacterium]|nr:hypothetical protein [Bacteroidales bacterium]